MLESERSRTDCAVDATMSVIEGRWKAKILCKLIMKGTFRFNQLLREMEGVSPRILSIQLREMELDGLVARKEYTGLPPKVEYSITPKGSSLEPILKAMASWSLRNLSCKIIKVDNDETTLAASSKSLRISAETIR